MTANQKVLFLIAVLAFTNIVLFAAHFMVAHSVTPILAALS